MVCEAEANGASFEGIFAASPFSILDFRAVCKRLGGPFIDIAEFSEAVSVALPPLRASLNSAINIIRDKHSLLVALPLCQVPPLLAYMLHRDHRSSPYPLSGESL